MVSVSFGGQNYWVLLCSRGSKVGKELLSITGNLLRHATSRACRQRVDTTVDFGEVKVPQLFGLSVTGCRSLSDHLKHTMATDFALAVINDPATVSNHLVNN